MLFPKLYINQICVWTKEDHEITKTTIELIT